MNKVCKDKVEYYTIKRLDDIQNQMLNLLLIVDSICKKNNLQYFLDGGTAIGAYRHKGFIPWDDDLDICLLKHDYLKLISILKTMDRSKYFLFDYEQQMHPVSFFGEKVGFFSCADKKKRHIYPIKIDIIPLNVIANTEDSLKENRIFRELSNYIFFGNYNIEYKEEIFRILNERFDGSTLKFMKFYNMEYGVKLPDNTDVLSRPSMNYSTKNVYSYNSIFPLKKICFSGAISYVPATDINLKDIYGDYLNYPDLDDRKPIAACVYRTWLKKPLYRFLINKNKKTKIQNLVFSVLATLSCYK